LHSPVGQRHFDARFRPMRFKLDQPGLEAAGEARRENDLMRYQPIQGGTKVKFALPVLAIALSAAILGCGSSNQTTTKPQSTASPKAAALVREEKYWESQARFIIREEKAAIRARDSVGAELWGRHLRKARTEVERIAAATEE
jgi:hypothetical protein